MSERVTSAPARLSVNKPASNRVGLAAWRPSADSAFDEREQDKLYWLDERISAGDDSIELGSNNSGRCVGGTTGLALTRGAEALGIDCSPTPLCTVSAPRGRSPPCVYRGMCKIRCSTNAKQSVLVAFIPRALAAGAEVRDPGHGRPRRDGPRRPRHRGALPPGRPVAVPEGAQRDRRRLRDVDNLFICDGSLMPTAGGVNPTMTIMANSARIADRIKAMAASGDLKAGSR